MARDTALHDYELVHLSTHDDILTVETKLNVSRKILKCLGVRGVSIWFGSTQRVLDAIETEPFDVERAREVGIQMIDGSFNQEAKLIVHLGFHTPDAICDACNQYEVGNVHD